MIIKKIDYQLVIEIMEIELIVRILKILKFLVISEDMKKSRVML
jgi:hypothetical protein